MFSSQIDALHLPKLYIVQVRIVINKTNDNNKNRENSKIVAVLLISTKFQSLRISYVWFSSQAKIHEFTYFTKRKTFHIKRWRRSKWIIWCCFIFSTFFHRSPGVYIVFFCAMHGKHKKFNRLDGKHEGKVVTTTNLKDFEAREARM